MDDKDKVDPVAGGFSSDNTWTFQGDYSFFGSDARESSVLNEFGWNFPSSPSVFDRIDSDVVGSSVSMPEVSVGVVATDAQSRSVDEAGDVSMSNPLVSTSSSEDRLESSMVSGDAASGGKPPSSERA